MTLITRLFCFAQVRFATNCQPARRHLALRALIASVFTALAAIESSEAQVGTSGKRLIEYGWDVPTPAQMHDELAAMEKRPFDGLIFRLSGGHNAFVTQPLDRLKFADDERMLRSVQFKRFHDNFVLIWGSPPADFDWFSDTQWGVIETPRFGLKQSPLE